MTPTLWFHHAKCDCKNSDERMFLSSQKSTNIPLTTIGVADLLKTVLLKPYFRDIILITNSTTSLVSLFPFSKIIPFLVYQINQYRLWSLIFLAAPLRLSIITNFFGGVTMVILSQRKTSLDTRAKKSHKHELYLKIPLVKDTKVWATKEYICLNLN